jgi:hypothetical protein
MIVFFALVGISCKRKIPEAHTSLEVVRIRYGILEPLLLWLPQAKLSPRPYCPRRVHGSLSCE